MESDWLRREGCAGWCWTALDAVVLDYVGCTGMCGWMCAGLLVHWAAELRGFVQGCWALDWSARGCAGLLVCWAAQGQGLMARFLAAVGLRLLAAGLGFRLL